MLLKVYCLGIVYGWGSDTPTFYIITLLQSEILMFFASGKADLLKGDLLCTQPPQSTKCGTLIQIIKLR
jgi:hypothetical protein